MGDTKTGDRPDVNLWSDLQAPVTWAISQGLHLTGLLLCLMLCYCHLGILINFWTSGPAFLFYEKLYKLCSSLAHGHKLQIPALYVIH